MGPHGVEIVTSIEVRKMVDLHENDKKVWFYGMSGNRTCGFPGKAKCMWDLVSFVCFGAGAPRNGENHEFIKVICVQEFP